jgi:hypothetical protein
MSEVIFSSASGWVDATPASNPAVVELAGMISKISGDVIPADVFKEEIKINKASILNALKEIGAESACVTYQGEGDSGGVNGVEINPPDLMGKAQKNKVVLFSVFAPWRKKDEPFSIVIAQEEINLVSAMEVFTDNFIDFSGHSGYENNEGGGGDVTFLPEEDKITLNHYYWELVKEECENVL